MDLARELIKLSGHGEQEITVEFSGLRAGEKLYEELLARADTTLPTRFDRVRIARLSREVGTDMVVRTQLQELVSEFIV